MGELYACGSSSSLPMAVSVLTRVEMCRPMSVVALMSTPDMFHVKALTSFSPTESEERRRKSVLCSEELQDNTGLVRNLQHLYSCNFHNSFILHLHLHGTVGLTSSFKSWSVNNTKAICSTGNNT